ncbi:ADP-ribosylglycohydrolase family protein [Actinoallomurus spadix]|uniref:ADP-ribosylglycohydrolase n=1 Tax=Actinoallomurus spadix TaxID=79912 RepID=A0ABP3GUI9_9ACTN|nr:ADP-ribosylglycohydrolase family protein [Actinoallomurus spadix]MCO5990851.1 ADP-ribosylglycohydrolase family protein [Actinoallomurus spadix]
MIDGTTGAAGASVLMMLTSDQRDRAAGVLLGAACGDALGVPYEFAEPLPETAVPEMAGGGLGPYAPGEYSDDTQMQVCVAEVAASGADLRSEEALDGIAERFLRWFHEGASDVGLQTSGVLAATARAGGLSRAMREASADLHRKTGRTAGNGSLMRTGIVALSSLSDPQAMAEAARLVSSLTHFDDLAGDACVLWCSGVRRAVLDGTLDGVREGLDLLPAGRRGHWAAWLRDAETGPPWRFSPNGFVVPALQAAWSAVIRTTDLTEGLVTAVRVGNDTDTVAAIAGALLGARYGASAVPGEWRAKVHGWPGLRADDLVTLARRTAEPAAEAAS